MSATVSICRTCGEIDKRASVGPPTNCPSCGSREAVVPIEVSGDHSRYGSPYYGLVDGSFQGSDGKMRGSAHELLVKGHEAASRLRQYFKEGEHGTQEADCHACDTEVLALRVENLTADYHSVVGGNPRQWGRISHRKRKGLDDLYEALEEYGKIVYGRGYLVARHIAMQRSPVCQFCGIASSEEAHHTALDYPADHEVTPGDLTMLCKSCHRDATVKRRQRGQGEAREPAGSRT